jgi:VWFA-related protein
MRPLLAVMLSSLSATLLPQPQQVFRSQADVVTIQAAVQSGKRPAAGLGTADFELRDNGVPQAITSLSVERVPLDLTVVLDLSASVDGPLLLRLKTAVRDTAAMLGGDDRIRLISVSHSLREIFDLRPRGQAMPLDDLVAGGATSLYDALAAAMMRPSEPGRRQLVMAFTDGSDSTSILTEARTQQIARLTDVIVDIVVPSTPPDLGDVPPILAGLVGPTAGQIFTLDAGDSISGIFKRVLDDFRASYVLQYVPQGVAPAGWHEVSVRVTKPGKYDVRARKGYNGGSS